MNTQSIFRSLCLVLAAALLGPSPAWSATRSQRFAVIVGANAGGTDRPALAFAVSDAERFGRVMTRLGGVAASDETILRQPKLKDLNDALDALTRRVVEVRRVNGDGVRTEIIFYYSGHADEKGLLLGDDRFSYLTLRERLDHIPADVRIAVLDACSSGAFTRVKSGKPRPAFLVDESSDMRGHAFLTSSSENEAAQESDRIRASYFTHYLVSGFRGAADASGDGKVTLNEAYQFAFKETLGKTVDTRGGAQHPSYDISLSGTGDVVMTDVRDTPSTLVLGEDLEGRFFVRTAAQELVVELYKPEGRRVELAVEAGRYDVRIERAKDALVTRIDVADGARVVLDPKQFGVAPAGEPTRRRGIEPSPFETAGRHRLEARVGAWFGSGTSSNAVTTSAAIKANASADDLLAGLQYTKYLHGDLAATVSVDVFGLHSDATTGSGVVSSHSVGGTAIPLGVRWYPVHGSRTRAVKPFVLGAVGPLFATNNTAIVRASSISASSITQATISGRAAGGIDVQFARWLSFDVEAGYNLMANFPEPIASHKNFNGAHVAIGIGWLFGKGYGG